MPVTSNGQRPEPTQPWAEPLRIVRSNLAVALEGMAHPTVLVTSAQPDEGKTAITANLAFSLAAAGQHVGVVDLDLRHPDLHHWFGASNQAGVSDVLLGTRSLEECVQTIDMATGAAPRGGRLYLLATGPRVGQPSELLSASKPAWLLERMATGVPAPGSGLDIVLVDTPPVLPVADALVIGRIVSGALLVVQAGRTRVDAVEHAKDALIRNQTRLFGLVMNVRSPRHGRDAVYGYGYG